MTTTQLESKPWGCILSFDNDVIVPIVEEHYKNLPKIINDFSRLYIQRKGRGKERELIRPMVKDVLLDLSDLLAAKSISKNLDKQAMREVAESLLAVANSPD